MEKHLAVLKACPLFAGIEGADLEALLGCLAAAEKKIDKNSFIFRVDEAVTSVGIVLSGIVHIIREDYWGNRTILAHIEPGGLFGEAFSCAAVARLPVSVVAAENASVFLIDHRKIVAPCSSACTFHGTLIKNLLGILARKNVMLTQKLAFITRRTTREKLLAYLSFQAGQAGCDTFEIPFNRQQLADYLSVDRSALSNELSKLQRAGVLTFRRNRFTLGNS